MLSITHKMGNLDEHFSGLEIIVEDNTSGEYTTETIRVSYLDLARMPQELKNKIEELSRSYNSNWNEDIVEKIELLRDYKKSIEGNNSNIINIPYIPNQDIKIPLEESNLISTPKITAEKAEEYNDRYLQNNIDVRITSTAMQGDNHLKVHVIIPSEQEQDLKSRGFKIWFDYGLNTTTIYWGNYKPYVDVQFETFESVKE